MNRIMWLTLALAVLLLPAVVRAAPDYSLQVDGLACPFCAYGIEKKLSSIEGVDDIQVDIKEGRVIVIMSEGSTMSEDTAREQVKKAGFTLRSFMQIDKDE